MDLGIRVDGRHVRKTTGLGRDDRTLRDQEGPRRVGTLRVVLDTNVSKNMVSVRTETGERSENDAMRKAESTEFNRSEESRGRRGHLSYERVWGW
jgi:hypothetical protein